MHRDRATLETIQELQWECLEHSPHSPNLAPSDLSLFDPPKKKKNTLVANVLLMTEVEREVQKWPRQQSKDVYAVGLK
jgi:hypothetical protein